MVLAVTGLAEGLYHLRVPKELRKARAAEKFALRRLRLADRECEKLKGKRTEAYLQAKAKANALANEVAFIRRNPESVEDMANNPIVGGIARGIYEFRRPAELRTVDRQIKLLSLRYNQLRKDLEQMEKEDYKNRGIWKSATTTEQALRAIEYQTKRDALAAVEKDLDKVKAQRVREEAKRGGAAAWRIGEVLNNPYRDLGMVNFGPQSELDEGTKQSDFNNYQYVPMTSTPSKYGYADRYMPESFPSYVGGHSVLQNPRRGMNEFMRFAMEFRRKHYPGKHSFHENGRIMKEAAAAYHREHRNPRDLSLDIPLPMTGEIRSRNARTAFWGTAALLAVYAINRWTFGKGGFPTHPLQ